MGRSYVNNNQTLRNIGTADWKSDQLLEKANDSSKYWRNDPLDGELSVAGPEMMRDAVYLLIDNKIITKTSFTQTSHPLLSAKVF